MKSVAEAIGAVSPQNGRRVASIPALPENAAEKMIANTQTRAIRWRHCREPVMVNLGDGNPAKALQASPFDESNRARLDFPPV